MNRFLYWGKDRRNMVKNSVVPMRVSFATHSNTHMAARQSRTERKKKKKQNLKMKG